MMPYGLQMGGVEKDDSPQTIFMIRWETEFGPFFSTRVEAENYLLNYYKISDPDDFPSIEEVILGDEEAIFDR
jgi:hypothetical protein